MLTFYPAQNFIASRQRLRHHSKATYLEHERFIEQNSCIRPEGGASRRAELRELATVAQLAQMHGTSRSILAEELWEGHGGDDARAHDACLVR